MIGKVMIGLVKVGDILDSIAYLVEECANLPNNPNPEKKSGYFTVFRKEDGRLLLAAQIGECPSDKYEKYQLFSYEKGARVYKRDDLSSWTSRDESKNKWGGAISTDDFILSFSGLPELADEAVVLVAALALKWANRRDVAAITNQSENPFFNGLRKRVERIYDL